MSKTTNESESASLEKGTFVEWQPNRSRKKRVLGWVVAENGCHIWQGQLNEFGYGILRVRLGNKHLAHRVRYEEEVGPIPEGLVLDHYVCNNGAGGCCNPPHCEAVTQSENARRSEALKRQRPKIRRQAPLTLLQQSPAMAKFFAEAFNLR